MSKPIPFHPLANLFPLIMGTEFDELVADVKSNGLREKIMLHEGQILDGRNRYRACIAAEIDAEFEMFSGADPVSYVISKNVHRRHLTPGQRGMAAADLCNLLPGRPKGSDKNTTSQEGVSTFEAAQKMGTSRATVERAKDVTRKGTPELADAVRAGKVDIVTAQKAARLAPEKQAAVVAEVDAGHANAVRTVLKKETRAAKEIELAAKQRALPDKKYGVIYADPEWDFEVYSRETGLDRSAENHYPTSTLDAIAKRDVGSIAAKDCVLFLWTTAPFLMAANTVIEAWGFTYKSNICWGKDKIGTGYWSRNKHEHLIIATRGDVPAPAPGTQWDSLIEAPVGAHSSKPDLFYELIEDYFPNLPKIELNARVARKGWDAWGLEAPETDNQDRLDPAMENQDYDDHFSQEVGTAGDEGNSGIGDHEDQREHDNAAGERAERGSDHHPDPGEVVGHAVTRADQAGAGQPSKAEGLVLQVASQRPAPMEIPSFLRRTKTEDA